MKDGPILALGEPMVEFNQTGDAESRSYLQGFGGDTSNFAISAARQGAKTAYVTAVGDDIYGGMLRELWRAEGVDQSGVATDPEAFTAIYFVTHDAAGHHFTFFRKGSAASRMKPAGLPRPLLQAASVLHLSGISLAISESACDTCYAAMDLVRAAGALVSFDTNLRSSCAGIGAPQFQHCSNGPSTRSWHWRQTQCRCTGWRSSSSRARARSSSSSSVIQTSGSAWSGGSSPAMLLAYMRCTVAAMPAWVSMSAHRVATARLGAWVRRFIAAFAGPPQGRCALPRGQRTQ